MNDKTQPSSRKDGFGTKGIGEDGDGTMGATSSSSGGTGAVGRRGADAERPVEGAAGEGDSAPGRRTEANKQGVTGQTD